MRNTEISNLKHANLTQVKENTLYCMGKNWIICKGRMRLDDR